MYLYCYKKYALWITLLLHDGDGQEGDEGHHGQQAEDHTDKDEELEPLEPRAPVVLEVHDVCHERPQGQDSCGQK